MELKAEKGKYRKKPVVVDAAEWLCKGHCPVWAQHAVREWHTFFQVTTPEGVMRGEPGDWIIRGAKGEISLCKADIFAATYEPADAEQPAAQAAGLTDDEIDALLDSVCHSDPRSTTPGEFCLTRDEIRALLSRAAPSVPEGYALVPVKLTAEMLKAGANSGGLGMDFHEWMGRLSIAWRNILAAAPQSSEQQADPCPGCVPGGVCKTPTCGRLQAREAERSRGKSVSQLVAECEADPHRKAALDRARERVAEQSPIHPEHMALLQSIASRLDGRLPRDVVGYIKKRYGTERADRDEIQALIDAAVNLVKVSGRYHSEIAYRRLATAANEYAAACREQMERANGR